MPKPVIFIATFVLSANAFGQTERKVSASAFFQVNKTLYDRTLSNNPGGFGAALQVFLNNKTKFKPVFEAAGDVFGGTKELYLTAEGRPIYAKSEVYQLLLGMTYHPFKNVYAGSTVGPSFFNAHAYLGIKPVVGMYLTKNERLAVKFSFIHIFHRDEISDKGFGYLSFSAGLRLL